LSSRVDVQGCLHKTCMPLPDRSGLPIEFSKRRLPTPGRFLAAGETDAGVTDISTVWNYFLPLLRRLFPTWRADLGQPSLPFTVHHCRCVLRSESLLKAVKVTYLQPCACRAWRQTLTGAAPCITQVVQIPNFASQYKSGDETPHLGLGHWAVVREAQRQVKCQ